MSAFNSALSSAVYETQYQDQEHISPESGAGALVKLIEQNNRNVESATADWLAFATQMDPNADGKTVVERRLQYTAKNDANQAHIALYGNRSIAQVQSGEKVVSKTVDFCASNNLAYWEARWESIKDEDEGMRGASPEKMLTMVRTEEARLNWAMVKAKYDAAVALYEALMSIPYVYEPYAERPVERPTSNNLALAAKLIRKS